MTKKRGSVLKYDCGKAGITSSLLHPDSPLRWWVPSSQTVAWPRLSAVNKGYNTIGHRVTKEGKVSLTWEGEGRLPRGGASFAES